MTGSGHCHGRTRPRLGPEKLEASWFLCLLCLLCRAVLSRTKTWDNLIRRVPAMMEAGGGVGRVRSLEAGPARLARHSAARLAISI